MDLKINDTNNTNSRNFSRLNSQENPDHLIRVIWLSTVLVFGTLGNFLLLAVLFRRGRITHVANLFNLNLAIADLIRIFVFIPTYLVYSSYDEWPHRLGLAGCRSVYIVVESTMTVSIHTLFFMSMERHKAVVHPLKKLMTIRQATYLIVLSWCLGGLANSLYTWSLVTVVQEKDGDRKLCGPFLERSLVSLALSIGIFVAFVWLPSTVFAVAYIKIIIKLRRDAIINPADVSQSSQKRYRRNLRAARILFIEMLFFVACLSPYFQASITSTANGSNVLNPLEWNGTIVLCMMISYSLINPFCHILLNSEFRKEVKKIYDQCRCFVAQESGQ